MSLHQFTKLRYLPLLTVALFCSCKSGTVNLFKPVSPHEQYQRKLVTAGLDKTSMGSAWIVSGYQSIQKPLQITIPYRETGYFAAEKISAASYRFTAVKGQKIAVNITKKPLEQFTIYADVWEQPEGQQMKLLASADTLNSPLVFEAKSTGLLFLRLQPELLRSGQYTLEISVGPSLSFPVKSSGSKNIGSIYGDGRDANARKHEGIDIFAPFRTPAIAAAEGTVTRVNENNLGGKVVWLRPKNQDYTLYYAHLDQQIATEGQVVFPGDTLGLIGNTGNAKTTPPHLHFGIYTSQGTVDPFPYVNTVIPAAKAINAPLNNLNTLMRTVGNSSLYNSPDNSSAKIQSLLPGTILTIAAANSNWYTVELPNGELGFVQSKSLISTLKPLRKLKLNTKQLALYNTPDSLAAVKKNLVNGMSVELLGNFERYHFIRNVDNETGWITIE